MRKPVNHLNIDGVRVGKDAPTYFIADIAANHDGDLQRAITLIHLAAEAGTNAAKFQHFNANTIVSEVGFESFSAKQSHQAQWGKSVFEVYQDASLDLNWTPALKNACDEAGIAFFSTPYALDLVDAIDQFVPAYKIGSGDITWLEIIEHIAKKNKQIFLSTGGGTIKDIIRACDTILPINKKLCVLHCTASYPVEISRDRLYAPMIDENLNLPKNTIPARKKKPSNPRSPVIIFILDEITKRRTKWENAWKKLRSLADGQTYRTYGNSNYLLCKIDVPHPKRLNSLIPAVEFEEDTNPPKKISIQRYSFRDTFQRLIKK